MAGMARRSRREFAVSHGNTVAFLGWTVGVMVYLATLAVAGALFSQTVLDRWSLSLAGVVTVQVPEASQPASNGPLNRIDAVTAILDETPGVDNHAVLENARTRALLEPWLGESLIAELPLPVMIDVRLERGARVDFSRLGERITSAAPGSVLDDHGLWLSRVAATASTLARGGWIVVLLVGLVAVISVVFAILSGLTVNRDIVELLKLMGARDTYIARRFQGHMVGTTLPVCGLGGLCAIGTVLAVTGLARENGATGEALPVQLSPAALSLLDWAIVAAVPVAFAILTVVTARLAALYALRRMS